MKMFEDWCLLNGCKPFGASPVIVARFVSDVAPIGICKVWSAVQEIARAHYIHGLSDPTLGGPVAAAINDIAKISAPRSWPDAEKARFATLPYDIQLVISNREADRDREVKHMHAEFAKLKKETENAVNKTDTNAAA